MTTFKKLLWGKKLQNGNFNLLIFLKIIMENLYNFNMFKVFIHCQSGMIDEVNFGYSSKGEVWMKMGSDIGELGEMPKFALEEVYKSD